MVMGDAGGAYSSPTGTGPQNGGAGQRQGNEQGLHNESFSLVKSENKAPDKAAGAERVLAPWPPLQGVLELRLLRSKSHRLNRWTHLCNL